MEAGRLQRMKQAIEEAMKEVEQKEVMSCWVHEYLD